MTRIQSPTLSAFAGSAPLLPDPAAVTTVVSTSNDALPNAPEPTAEGVEGQTSLTSHERPGQAARYARIVLPGLATEPLSGGQKVVFAFRHAATPFNVVSALFASAYSQGVDSAPHYGQGWGPFAQRYGAASARGTAQILASDGIFSPIFHDDPRYYELGRQSAISKRVIYAVTRVVITRSDAGQQRVNYPLLSGYAVAAALNNTFYPQQDRTAKTAATAYGGSIAGAAVGFFSNEFLDDFLRATHLRK